MKKIIFILIMVSSLLLTACSTSNKWTKSDMGGIEKPTGEIKSVTKVSGGLKYFFTNMEIDDITSFINLVKNNEYNLSVVENNSDDKITYYSKNSVGNSYEIIYNKIEKTCTVTYISNATNLENNSENKESIVNTIEWDSNKMGGLPAPIGFQFDRIESGEQGYRLYYSKASIDEFNDYLEVTKNYDYTMSISKNTDSTYITYISYKDSDADGFYEYEFCIMYNSKELSGYITVAY